MKKILPVLLVIFFCLIGLSSVAEAADCCADSDTWWYFYEGYHHGICTVCGSTKVEKSHHIYENGVCTVCQFSPCSNGGHAPGLYNPHECPNCLMLSDCKDRDGDGLCDLCGQRACDCTNCQWVPYGDGHQLVCQNCGNVLMQEDRHIIDSTTGSSNCLTCGAPCPHKNTADESTPEEHFVRCMDCWEVLVERGPHNIVDGVCTVCNYDGCDHGEGKFSASWNNIYHELSCGICQAVVVPWSPHTLDPNGVCTECQFVRCEHGTLEEAKDVTLLFDTKCHWYRCNLCEYLYAEQEPHRMVDGVCTVCAAKPCQDGAHASAGKDIPHICLKCMVILGCRDLNGDCLCDDCKTEHHNMLVETTEAAHQQTCLSCNYCTGWEPHYDFDGYVGCDHCGYGKPKPEEKVEIAENVPETEVKLPVDSLLTDADRQQIANGVNVEVKVNIQNADETVTQEERDAVISVVKQTQSQQVVLYLDIDLTKTVGEAEVAKIRETVEMITITITIPEEYRAENRSYSVIRVHDGVATELLDLDSDPNTVTIQTDRFSVYALSYRDGTEEEKEPVDEPGEGTPETEPVDGNPQEAPDLPAGAIVAICVAAVVAVGAVLLILLGKKRNRAS